MNIKKAFIASTIVASLLSGISASAQTMTTNPDKPHPTVSEVTGTTATLTANLGFRRPSPTDSFHFEYIQARMVCPMIYPPIPACVPVKTADNVSPVVIKGLVPGKTYSVSLVTKEQVECIQAPCAPVEYITPGVEFTTTSKTAASVLALDISNIGSTTATVSLNDAAKSGLSADDQSRIYFTYQEVNIICKIDCSTATTKGTSAALSGLKPATTYKVRAVEDSSIKCFAAPCPTNFVYGDEFTFTTLNSSGEPASVTFTRPLRFGSTGKEVTALQNILIASGFMTGTSTGYFGKVTMHALKDYQKSHGLPPVGNVGPMTRALLNNQN